MSANFKLSSWWARQGARSYRSAPSLLVRALPSRAESSHAAPGRAESSQLAHGGRGPSVSAAPRPRHLGKPVERREIMILSRGLAQARAGREQFAICSCRAGSTSNSFGLVGSHHPLAATLVRALATAGRPVRNVSRRRVRSLGPRRAGPRNAAPRHRRASPNGAQRAICRLRPLISCRKLARAPPPLLEAHSRRFEPKARCAINHDRAKCLVERARLFDPFGSSGAGAIHNSPRAGRIVAQLVDEPVGLP